MRLLAQLAREPVSNDFRVARERSYSLRETINGNFEKVRALGDGVLLEFGRRREQDLAIRNQIMEWQIQLRMLFLAQIATWKYRARLPGFELPQSVATAQKDFDGQLAESLEAIADEMEGKPSQIGESERHLAALREALSSCDVGIFQQSKPSRLQAFFSLYRRIEELAIFAGRAGLKW